MVKNSIAIINKEKETGALKELPGQEVKTSNTYTSPRKSVLLFGGLFI